MARKIIGFTLIIICCMHVIYFMTKGLPLPNLLSAIVMGVIGIIILTVKKKVKA